MSKYYYGVYIINSTEKKEEPVYFFSREARDYFIQTFAPFAAEESKTLEPVDFCNWYCPECGATFTDDPGHDPGVCADCGCPDITDANGVVRNPASFDGPLDPVDF